MKINIKLLVIILLIILFLNNKKIQLFILYSLFSLIAPTTKNNIYQKKISDKIYNLKYKLENEIKIPIPIDKNAIEKVTEIEYNSNFTKKDFIALTKNLTKPLLIKNIFNKEELDKYTIKNLVKNHGNIIITPINIKSDGNINYIETTFSDFINRINKNEKLYLTVNNSLANSLDMTVFNDFLNILFDDYGIRNIFIGNKNSSTHLHCELAASCALQLGGVKKWFLVDPKYSEHLHSIPDKNNIFHLSSVGFNINKMNNELNNIPHYEIICNEGDFLYVPPWWWHETLNLTDNSVMLSSRPILFLVPYKNNFLYTLNGIKISLGYNNLIYPLLKKLNIIDPNEDTVVNSTKEIKNRIPDNILI